MFKFLVHFTVEPDLQDIEMEIQAPESIAATIEALTRLQLEPGQSLHYIHIGRGRPAPEPPGGE